VLHENKFQIRSVYNVDKTGISTVEAPNKITTAKGNKQVGFITSAKEES
jgi:hypothetical protein